MTTGTAMTAADDVPDDTTLLVTLRDDGEEVEFVLVRDANGDVRAWRNECQHWTDVSFDHGDGATVRDGELVCGKHGATFECDTGYCDFGPCEGAYLTEADVAVADGDVRLVDDGYEFVRVGGVEGDRDLSTSPGERLGF